MQRPSGFIAILAVFIGIGQCGLEARAQVPGELDDEPKATSTEVSFQADGSPVTPVMATREFDDIWGPIYRVEEGFAASFGGNPSGALTNWDAGAIEAAKNLFLSQNLKPGEDPAPLEAAFYAHTLLQAVATLPKDASDAEIEMRIGGLVNQVAHGDAGKYLILQVLSIHLNTSYNDYRNPGQGNHTQQDQARALAAQNGVPFSTGDLSLMQILRAAGLGEADLGGVCNDNAQALAKLASKFFPSQDTFVINQGGHFVLALYDGKTVRLIDSYRYLENRNTLGIFPSTRTANLRINQVIDGKLVQVANVSTAAGALIDKMTGDSTPRLLSEPVGNRLVGTIAGQGPFRASAGVQSNGLSKLTLVLGQYEHKGKHSDFRVAMGGGADFRPGDDTHYVGVFQVSYRYSRILVLRPKFELSSVSGIRIEGFGTWFNGADEMGGVEGLSTNGISGALSLQNGLRLKSSLPHGFSAAGAFMIEHDLGSASWGDTGGASSILDSEGIQRTLAYTKLLFNQAVVRVEVLKRLSPERSAFVQGSYQGSNIGQLTVGNAGIEQRFGNGVVARAFGGYTLNSGGYRTKNSLLFGPQGAQVGVQVAKRNLSAGMSVSGIGGGDQPLVQVQAAIRIGRKRQRLPVILSP